MAIDSKQRERVLSKVERREGECWIWKAAISANGYAKVYWEGRMEPAHRILYLILRGPIPDGFDLDHLCRNRGCVNPDHLEPVTRRENLHRGDGPLITRQRTDSRTHCRNGHPLTDENTFRPGARGRWCRICRRNAANRYHDKVRGPAKARKESTDVH